MVLRLMKMYNHKNEFHGMNVDLNKAQIKEAEKANKVFLITLGVLVLVIIARGF